MHDDSSRPIFSPTSFILTTVGLTACIVGFFGVPWVRVDMSEANKAVSSPKFTELATLLRILELFSPDRTPFLVAYFTWIGFALAALTTLFAIVSALPTGAVTTFRVLGALAGVASAMAALFAPLIDGIDPFGNYLQKGLGIYFVVGGSMTMAIGAALGAAKQTRLRNW